MKKIHAAIWMALSLGRQAPLHCQTPLIPTVSVTIDNYNRAQTDVNFAGVVKNGGFGKIPAWPRACSSCSTRHRPAQPRHVVFIRDCRPRCRGGVDYSARRR